jgi:hypothetical protein
LRDFVQEQKSNNVVLREDKRKSQFGFSGISGIYAQKKEKQEFQNRFEGRTGTIGRDGVLGVV